MASKYDAYWRGKLTEIRGLLDSAAKQGASSQLDVSDIQALGVRYSWYGLLEVSKGKVRRGEMAHATSLGNVMIQSGLLDPYDCTFRLTINSRLQLTAKVVSGQPTPQEGSYQPLIASPSATREQALVEILRQLPAASWQQVCEEEPEWKIMHPFLSKYGFGPFAVLMIMTGLNDYQLKGKAEHAYWPPLGMILHKAPPPSSPAILAAILRPFYRTERYDTSKLSRLNKFLSSPLARKLWGLSAENTAQGFLGIWQELANTMNQKPSDKTISFAMKCLGLSLLMAGDTAFDFARIPIPVDIRVVAFTQRAGLLAGSEHEQVIALWDRVLHSLQEHQESLSMIHLDSLIWQIASLGDSELLRYFERIGASDVGQQLRAYLAQEKQEAPAIEFPSSRLQTTKGRVVCFIPCCSSKNPSGEIISPRGLLGAEELPTTWPLLAKGRNAMEYCIDRGSKPTTALSLYNGAIYKPLSGIKREIVQQIAAGELRLYVISAGYGVLNALELAQGYDAVLQGAVAKQWRENGLSDIIAEIILSNNPSRVYGFFSGEVFWSAQSSSYRYFYTEGVKAALAKGLSADAGCFYREQGMGVQAILGGLGRTFAEFVVGGYDSEYVRNVEQRGRQDGDVKIGYRRIT